MAMGFSQLEARLALRACDGNVTLAISHIVKKNEVRTSYNEQHEGNESINAKLDTMGTSPNL